jgi:hypothetical protein
LKIGTLGTANADLRIMSRSEGRCANAAKRQDTLIVVARHVDNRA